MQVGPKQQSIRDLPSRAMRAKHHQMMIEDGCPPVLLREGDAPKIRPQRKPDAGVTLAPPLAVQKAIAAEFSEPITDQPEAEASPTPEQQETETVATKSKTKKASTKSTASKPKATSHTNGASNGGIRPGSKIEIVANLLKRPEGCTTAEVLAATNWLAVSMPAMAKSAGLTLKKEKDGKISRYHAA